jgi:hypothetical protein
VPATSTAPSTEISVEWSEPPPSAAGDGGSALSGYLVEWWEAHSAVPEVQAVHLTWPPAQMPPPAQSWTLKYLGAQTNALAADESPANVRDALMSLHGPRRSVSLLGANHSGFLFGPLEVTRSPVGGDAGFTYSVTFTDDSADGSGVGGRNDGDLPLLPVKDVFLGGGAASAMYEVVPGVRAGGYSEVQWITSFGTGEGRRGAANCDDAVVRGFWRVAFGGSAFSAYLSTEANASSVAAALEQLPTVGVVKVSREAQNVTYGGAAAHGYVWAVTFVTPVGNVAAMTVDAQFVYSTNGDAGFTVQDGDNAVSDLGVPLCAGCAAGESPVGYKSVLVDPDARGYLIQGLTTGTAYKVAVSAVNKHGQGVRQDCNGGGDVKPPVVVPGLPVGVAVTVHAGSGDSLTVAYQPPLSDGGARITHYRVELDPATTSDYRDPTTTFQSPIAQRFDCPALPTYAVWTVSLGAANETIESGHFALELTRGGYTASTDPMPFDAPARSKDEAPHVDRARSKVYCEANLAYCQSDRLRASGSLQSKLEALEALSGGVEVSRRTVLAHPGTVGYVWSVTFLDAGDDFDLKPAAVGKDGTATLLVERRGRHTATLAGGAAADKGALRTAKVQAGVVHGACTGPLVVPGVGGLVTGQYYYARAFAYNQVGYGAPQVALAPEKPMVAPGRPTGVALEVHDATSLKCIFLPPTDDGGDAVDSYLVEYAPNPDFAGALSVSVIMLSAGAPFYRLLPNLKAGQDYWVRVKAHNSQGYGNPQAASPAFEHPYVEPGPPSNVRLGVTSDTMLTVGFDYPLDDGGDRVTLFRVEWDTSPSFNSLSSHPDKGSAVVTEAAARSFTVEYLTTYRTYFVRVAAANAAGWGQPRLSSPATGVPALQVPGTPVQLTAQPGTHPGYLSVRFDPPRVPRHGIPCGGLPANPARCPTPVGGVEDGADGGAEVTSYDVEWSIDPAFSATQYDAGKQLVVGATAFTARNLTVGATYFARVAARNVMGFSAFCTETGNLCSSGTPAHASTTNTTRA